jgi:hypothetical protein
MQNLRKWVRGEKRLGYCRNYAKHKEYKRHTSKKAWERLEQTQRDIYRKYQRKKNEEEAWKQSD